MRTSLTLVAVLIGMLFAVGCSQPTSPSVPTAIPSGVAPVVSSSATGAPITVLGKPGYEPAYYNGTTVTINAIEVRQNVGPLAHAAADFYETVYPPNHALWPDTPQCNPCDHEGNGIDFTDFHNHVLDSIPSNPGHGEFNPLWHVFVILPADMSPAGQAAYAALLPMKSEAAIDAAIAAGVAQEIDTGFYFLCAVVSPNAGK
jgi:hypothetical protein